MYQTENFVREDILLDSDLPNERVMLSPEAAESLVPSKTLTDVNVAAEFDDPITAYWLLTHLRTLLHRPDIEHLEVNLSVTFSGLDSQAVKALEEYEANAWQNITVGVLKRETIYHRERQA